MFLAWLFHKKWNTFENPPNPLTRDLATEDHATEDIVRDHDIDDSPVP